jgi:hypothetical protein
MTAAIIKFPHKPKKEKKPRKVRERRLDWYRDFGERLRATRLVLGITEAEAAAAFLITLRTYRRREAGLMFNDPYGLLSFATKYDICVDWLAAGKGSVAAALTARSRRATFKVVPNNMPA